jgi:hypothetical protein
LPETVVPAISDTGGVVVYDTVDTDAEVDPEAAASSLEARRVWIRDRVGDTGRAVAETGSVAPGVSGNGCIVAYTVIDAGDMTLTAVDRCATPIESPLPIGTMLDTVALDTPEPDADVIVAAEPQADESQADESQADESQTDETRTDEPAPDTLAPQTAVADSVLVAPPSLSFDGSTIVWSTGREIRRYARPASGAPYVRSHTFDTVANGSPDIVTGIHTDVSADGSTVVFVAGPGTSRFEPVPANVHVWTLATAQGDAELISSTTSGDPGASDSAWPTITADGSFVVFQSNSSELAVVGSEPMVAPFVVGVDLAGRTAQVLVDDADRPTVSADGQHVVYRRGDAVRVLSSDATSTTDQQIDELLDARPIGALSISQFGRWIVFAGTLESASGTLESASGTLGPASDEPSEATRSAPAVWAVDRVSSSPDVVDTTTTSTTPAGPPTPTPPPTPTAPPSPTPPPTVTSTTVLDVESQPTVPTTTTPLIVDQPRFPTVTNRFPRVELPRPRPVQTSSSAPRVGPQGDSGAALAAPVTFEPTVIDAGRRTQPVNLTNTGSRTLQVVSASIDVPDVFTVVGDTCSGSPVAPSSSCALEVQFAPIAVGPVNATVTFRLADGALVVAQLAGEGVPEPTLDLVPAVAGAGQTVTVFGAGFPPGVTVELSRPGTSTFEPIAVDADGTFAHVIVVLPNTPTGSALLTVNSQPDAFHDVMAQLLVSSRGSASAGTALRGGPGGALGR